MKKCKTSLTFLFLLMLFVQNSYSQDEQTGFRSRIGVQLSLGASTLSGLQSAVNQYGYLPDVDYTISSFSSGYTFAVGIGISTQYEKPKNFFIQSDFYYSISGASTKGVTTYSDTKDIDAMTLHSFRWKTYLGKKFRIGENKAFIVGLGPYVSWNLALFYTSVGEFQSADDYSYVRDDDYEEDYEDDYSSGDYGSIMSLFSGDKAKLNRFEFGVSPIVGFELGKFQLALTADYGLTRIVKDSHFNLKNRALMFLVTCYF